jgi:hypothetical protein
MVGGHDPRGWFNTCMRRQEDGQPCGLAYWLAWPRGVRRTAPDSDQRHVCRGSFFSADHITEPSQEGASAQRGQVTAEVGER